MNAITCLRHRQLRRHSQFLPTVKRDLVKRKLSGIDESVFTSFGEPLICRQALPSKMPRDPDRQSVLGKPAPKNFERLPDGDGDIFRFRNQ